MPKGKILMGKKTPKPAVPPKPVGPALPPKNVYKRIPDNKTKPGPKVPPQVPMQVVPGFGRRKEKPVMPRRGGK